MSRDTKWGTASSETGSGYAYTLYVIENGQEYNTGTISDPDEVGVKAVDSTTLRIRFEYPASYALSILSMWIARPMPQWAIEAHGEAWTEPANIVTNGPYELSEWAHNDHITLDKRPTYYDAEKVQVERVKMWMVDDATAWQMYLDGQLDTTDPPFDVLDDIRADPLLSQELIIAPQAATYSYGFSVSQEPFDDALVRRAFSAAIDRRGLIAEVLGGGQVPALTYTPPGLFGHVDGYAEGIGLPYNPIQARRWLADAGHPDGDGLPAITLWFNTSAGHQLIAEYIQDGWQSTLGVSVTLESLPWADYLDARPQGQFQIWRGSWSMDYADANNFLDDGVDRASLGNWHNPTYESLVDQAAREQDPDVRRGLYRQAEEILVETDAVIAPLYYYSYVLMTKPYLERTYSDSPFDISTWRITRGTDIVGPDGGDLAFHSNDVTVEIPAGTLTDTVVFTYTPATGVPPGGNLNSIGKVFDLTAVYADTGQPAQIAPGHTCTITVHYTYTELGPTVEDTLALYGWDEGADEWTQDGITSSVDTAQNVVSAQVDHLSRFSVLGETHRVYLPLVRRRR